MWVREFVYQTCSINMQQEVIFCILHRFLFPVVWWRVAWAVMLTCLQLLHHPSGNWSQLGTSFRGEQTLNGLTGCVRALRPRVKRRWLLDGNAKQPRDTQRTFGAARRASWGCRSHATGWYKEHRLKRKWVWDITVNSAVTENVFIQDSYKEPVNPSVLIWTKTHVSVFLGWQLLSLSRHFLQKQRLRCDKAFY